MRREALAPRKLHHVGRVGGGTAAGTLGGTARGNSQTRGNLGVTR